MFFRFNKKDGVVDIILPTILVQGGPGDESHRSSFNRDIVLPAIQVPEQTTRRIGYDYEPPLDEPRLELPPSKPTKGPRRPASAKTKRPKLTSTIDYKAPKKPLSNTLGALPPSKPSYNSCVE